MQLTMRERAAALLLGLMLGACSAERPAGSGGTPVLPAASTGGPDQAAAGTEAAGPPGIMLVLDSSGSMWGQIGGETKRDIARKALDGLIADLPSGTEVGLMAYGHRRTADCDDIELLMPLAAADRAALAGAIDSLVPRGRTPLTGAVRAAAAAAGDPPARATVLLVTDGVETCAEDPCGAIRELAAASLSVTVHVVGFGLPEADARAVACIADETGGRYFDAADAGGLRHALSQAAETLSVPPVTIASPPAALQAPDAVEIGAVFEVAWTGPGDARDYVDIVAPDLDGFTGERGYAWTREGSPLSLRAPAAAGPHRLRYVWDGPAGRRVLAERLITFTQADAAVVPPMRAEAGGLIPVEWAGPGGTVDYIDLVLQGTASTGSHETFAYVRDGNPVALKGPGAPGLYEVRYILSADSGDEVLATAPVEITGASVELAFAPEISLGELLEVHWRGPGHAGDYIAVVPQGEPSVGGERAYRFVRDGNPLLIALPGAPGAYEVRYLLETARGPVIIGRASLQVDEAEVSLAFAPAVPAGAELEVVWDGPGSDGDYIDVVPHGFSAFTGQRAYRYTQQANPVRIQMPGRPGAYQVRYVLSASGGDTALASQPLEITPVTAVLDAPETAGAGSQVAVRWSGPGHQNDYVDIVPRGSSQTSGELAYRYTSEGDELLLPVPETAGAYDLRYLMEAPDGRFILARRPLEVR